MTRIRISPTASILPTSVGVVIRSDLSAYNVGGKDAQVFLESLVPLLDGARDLAAVQAALPRYSAKSVAALVEQLRARGFVEEVPEDGAPPEARRSLEAFLRAFPGDPAAAARRLADARVLVAGGARWAQALADELAASGVGVVEGPRAAEDVAAAAEPVHLVVATVAPHAREAMERVSRFAHERRVPSLWAHLAGTTAIVGPYVDPGQTACRICASEVALSPAFAVPATRGGDVGDEARGGLLAHLVALEAIKLITGHAASRLGGRVLVQDLAAHTSALHNVVRLPWCAVCGKGR